VTGRVLATAISFLWLPCMLRAQGIQAISWTELGPRASGHKVVVSLKSGDSVQGRVVRWDGQSLTVKRAKTGQEREILPLEVSLVRVEARRGRAGRDTGTVVVSAALSAGLGTLIGWGVDALRTGKAVLYRIEAAP
jgi:hypothetical protein